MHLACCCSLEFSSPIEKRDRSCQRTAQAERELELRSYHPKDRQLEQQPVLEQSQQKEPQSPLELE